MLQLHLLVKRMEKVAEIQKVQNMLVVIQMGKRFIHPRLENTQIKFRITQIVVMAVVLIIDPVAVEIIVRAVEVEIEIEIVGVEEEEVVEEVEIEEIIISEEIIEKIDKKKKI